MNRHDIAWVVNCVTMIAAPWMLVAGLNRHYRVTLRQIGMLTLVFCVGLAAIESQRRESLLPAMALATALIMWPYKAGGPPEGGTTN